MKDIGAANLIDLRIGTLLTAHSLPGSVAEERMASRKLYSQAITVQAFSPKFGLFFLTFLPQSIVPDHGSVVRQSPIRGA